MSDEARKWADELWTRLCSHPGGPSLASSCLLCIEEALDRYAKADKRHASADREIDCEHGDFFEVGCKPCLDECFRQLCRTETRANGLQREIQRLREEADRRVQEEREACAKACCKLCADGLPPTFQPATRRRQAKPGYWIHEDLPDRPNRDCAAHAIRERARGLAPEPEKA